MPPVGSEPTIPASERSQTHALDRTATGIRLYFLRPVLILSSNLQQGIASDVPP